MSSMNKQIFQTKVAQQPETNPVRKIQVEQVMQVKEQRYYQMRD